MPNCIYLKFSLEYIIIFKRYRFSWLKHYAFFITFYYLEKNSMSKIGARL